jgi:hypothetical protein
MISMGSESDDKDGMKKGGIQIIAGGFVIRDGRC